MTIHPISGTISWPAPGLFGVYTIAIEIQEYRNGNLVGSTILDYTFEAINFPYGPTFTSQSTVPPMNLVNDYIIQVNPGDTVNIEMAYIDFQSYGYSLKGFSESLVTNNPATYFEQPGSASVFGSYEWVTDASHVRNHPWVLTIRGVSGSTNPQSPRTDVVFLIYVGNNPPTNIEQQTTQLPPSIYPNPISASTQLVFQETPNNATLRIYNTAGQLVHSAHQINTTKYTVGEFTSTSGIYFYDVVEGNKKLTSGKLTVD